MAEEIETLLVAVRADTQLFARDVAAMKAELAGPFAAGADQAGRMLENALVRALRIVDEGLKAPLDTAGGALTENLASLYGYISLRLTQANLHNDVAALDECVKLLEPVRSAWLAIDPAANAANPT